MNTQMQQACAAIVMAAIASSCAKSDGTIRQELLKDFESNAPVFTEILEMAISDKQSIGQKTTYIYRKSEPKSPLPKDRIVRLKTLLAKLGAKKLKIMVIDNDAGPLQIEILKGAWGHADTQVAWGWIYLENPKILTYLWDAEIVSSLEIRHSKRKATQAPLTTLEPLGSGWYMYIESSN